MRALSLWQPWASLIATGRKKIETRHWDTKYRGDLIIHAAKRKLEKEDIALALEFGLVPGCVPNSIPLGVAVCVAELYQVRPTYDVGHLIGYDEARLGNYGPGRFAWRLYNVRPLLRPVPMRGRQGLWTPTPEEIAAVNEQLKGAVAL